MRSHVSLAACLALAIQGVLSWEFLSEADTRHALDSNEFSLVACKLQFNPLCILRPLTLNSCLGTSATHHHVKTHVVDN